MQNDDEITGKHILKAKNIRKVVTTCYARFEALLADCTWMSGEALGIISLLILIVLQGRSAPSR